VVTLPAVDSVWRLHRQSDEANALVSCRDSLKYAGSGETLMKRQPTKGPSQRQLRAGELLRHTLAQLFQTEDIEDAELKGEIITVGEVRVSPDLKHATVFTSARSGKDSDTIAAALNRHQRFLRGVLARLIELKYVPELVFKGDHHLDEAGRIDDLLRSPEVARDLKSET
jgi:ribosome-binding factor A